MKQYIQLVCLLFILALLSGFFWEDVTWESVNATIDRKYPSIENISTDELKKMLDSAEPPVIIDVRSKNEYKISHLPGSHHISDVTMVVFEKDTSIVAYCSVGVRSAEFLLQLQKRGYKKIKNLRGSIFDWANKGFPLVREMIPVYTVHPYNRKWGRLLNPDKHQYKITK